MVFVPDVGVLIVHGIGTQAEGSELRQWVDALLRYLDACPAATDAGTETRILQPSPDDKLVRLHTPPLGGTGEGNRQRWLIGEAWWADAFDVPDRKAVSRWMVGVSSWFLYLFVVRLWRRFAVDWMHLVPAFLLAGWVVVLFRRATGPGTVSWADVGIAAALFLPVVASCFRRQGKKLGGIVVLGTLLIGYPLAALVTGAATVLWLVGLLPGKVSEKARALQISLAQSVGDVYAVIASRRREQAMFDAITAAARRLTTALGAEKKPLVLLAHSQGAALTYRALNTDKGLREVLAGRKLTVVTYGGAVVPIHLLEQRLTGPKQLSRKLLGFAGYAGLLLFAFSLVRLANDGVDEVARWSTNLSVPLVIAAFVASWRQEKRARCDPDEVNVGPEPPRPSPGRVRIGLRSPEGTELRWVDMWAPWDPVPNGPLGTSPALGHRPLPPLAGGSEFLSCRVANLHQPWRDHVVYRDNPEDVVSRWVGEIAARAQPSVAPAMAERPRGGDAEIARRWRNDRGKCLFVGQVAALVVGFVIIALRWEELSDLGRRVVRRIPLRSALSSLADLVPEGARDGLLGSNRDASHLHGLLVALGTLLAVIFVASKVVSAAQKAGTGAYLAPDDRTGESGGWVPVVAAAVLGVGGMGAWAAFVLDAEDAPTRPVRVHPAVIVEQSGTEGPSRSTTVAFHPVGTGDDTPVTLKVEKTPRTIGLDAAVDYRITATATSAEDCTVTAEPPARPTDVRVTCKGSGALLPRAGR